jgi:hypothetical protein
VATVATPRQFAQDSPLTEAPSPPPPRLMTERPAGPSRSSIPWLIAISLVVAGMVWFTLWQIQSIAIENARTPDEAAQCVAELPESQQAEADDLCSTEPNVILAARNPVRNSLIVFGLCLVVGYLYLVLNSKGNREQATDV